MASKFGGTYVIIKTDLELRSAYGLNHYKTPYAWVERVDERYVHFLCMCGSKFKLRSTNQYISEDQYQCPDCKRTSRLMPLIGERYVFKRIRSDAAGAGRVFEIGFE